MAVETFILQDANGGGRLELSLTEERARYHAHLTLSTLEAETDVYGFDPQSLPQLLEQLAAHWQDWKRAEVWQSVEGELRLEFRHDEGGHVRVEVRMRRYVPEEWSVQTTFNLRPDELGELARAAAEFFANFGERAWN